MSTFTVALPESLKPFLESQAAARGLEGPDAYVQAVLERAKLRAEIEAKLLEGVEELDKGLGIPVTPEYWEKLRAEFCQRHGLPVNYAPRSDHRSTG